MQSITFIQSCDLIMHEGRGGVKTYPSQGWGVVLGGYLFSMTNCTNSTIHKLAIILSLVTLRASEKKNQIQGE